MARKRRSLVTEKRFDEERDALNPDIERWDEVFESFDLALAQDPLILGKETDESGIYAITTGTWPGAPPVVIYFRYDDDTVTLLSIREEEATEES